MNTKKFLENLKNERFESELDLLGYISDMIFDNPIVIMLEEIVRYNVDGENDTLHLLTKYDKNYKIYIKSNLEGAYIYKVETCNNVELYNLKENVDFYLINKYTQKKTIFSNLSVEDINREDILIINERYREYDVMTLEIIKHHAFNTMKELIEKLILGVKSEKYNFYIKQIKYAIEDIADEDDNEDDDETLYIYTYLLYIDNKEYTLEIHKYNNEYSLYKYS